MRKFTEHLLPARKSECKGGGDCLTTNAEMLAQSVTGEEGHCLVLISVFQNGSLATLIEPEVCNTPGGIDWLLSIIAGWGNALLDRKHELDAGSEGETLQ